MPFTVSHAGFVLPLRKAFSSRVVCGLVIGSVAPDFPYFAREFGIASFAHTMRGAACVCLPVGLLVYFVVCMTFRRVARMLPAPHSAFVTSWGLDRTGMARGLAAVIAAILAGALSHNFIDGFTHGSGAGVSMFPVLSREACSIGGEPLHVFRALQYSGSILGLAVILSTYSIGMRQYCRVRGIRIWQDSQRWLVLLGVTAAAALVAVVLNARFVPGAFEFHAIRAFAFKFLITWLPTIGGALVLLAALSPPATSSGEGTGPDA